MATAVMAGSLLTGIGSGIAGVSAGGAFLGLSATAWGAASAATGIAGQVYGSYKQQAYYDAQLETSNMAMQSRNQELQLQMDRERTQRAVNEAERQRKLKRILASQRAAFAGGGIDAFSGSPINIQEATIEEMERESKLVKLQSDQTLATLKINQGQNQIAGQSEQLDINNRANTSMQESMQNIATQGQSLIKLYKNNAG